MDSNEKKKIKGKLENGEMLNFAPWLRKFILFIYELSLFRILAVAIGLLIIVGRGNLFSNDGLILSLLILLFLLLRFLRNWSMRDSE